MVNNRYTLAVQTIDHLPKFENLTGPYLCAIDINGEVFAPIAKFIGDTDITIGLYTKLSGVSYMNALEKGRLGI